MNEFRNKLRKKKISQWFPKCFHNTDEMTTEFNLQKGFFLFLCYCVFLTTALSRIIYFLDKGLFTEIAIKLILKLHFSSSIKLSVQTVY